MDVRAAAPTSDTAHARLSSRGMWQTDSQVHERAQIVLRLPEHWLFPGIMFCEYYRSHDLPLFSHPLGAGASRHDARARPSPSGCII